MIVHIIRYLYFFLIVGTPFIVYSRTSELFEFNKMMLIYFTTVGIVGLWILDRVRTGAFALKFTWWMVPFAIFFASQVIATIFSIDVHTSFFGYYGRFNGGLLSIMTYLALGYILVQVADKSYIIRFLQVAFGAAVAVVGWGIPGRYGADLSCLVFTGRLTNACWTDQFKPAERMFSTLGQPNWLGAYLVVAFFVGLYFMLRKETQSKWVPILYGAGAYVIFLGVLFTRSRSALVALGVCSVLYAIGYVFTHRHLIKKQARLIGGLAVVVLLSIIILKTGIEQIDRYLSFPSLTKQQTTTVTPPQPSAAPAPATNVTDSFDIRKVVWEGAIELGKRYPLFGTGVETFAYSYYFTRPQSHNATSEWDFLYNKAHNEFLNYFATTGIVGFGAYVLMIGAVCWYLIRRLLPGHKHPEDDTLFALSLLAGYLSISITNFFGFSITSVQLFFYLIPACAFVLFKPKWKEIEIRLPESALFIKGAQFASILLMVMGGIYYSRYVLADITYATAETYQRSGEYQQAFTLYETALALRYEHVYEDKFSTNLANLAFLASYDTDSQLTQDLIKLSRQFNDRSLAASPYNVLYWKTKSKNSYLFYQATLKKDYLSTAVQSMEKAEELAPTDPKLPYTLALFYSLAADEEKDTNAKLDFIDKSLKTVRKSIDLKPDYLEAIELRSDLEKKRAITATESATLED